MPDVTCVIHLHSTYSDGTGTVAQIARGARRAGAQVVLLTDHDNLRAKRFGEEGWHDGVLVCVGEEVSPKKGGHYLAFGIDEPIRHRRLNLGPREIVAAVAEAGGFGFWAHPWSQGSERFRRSGVPALALDDDGYTGVELWSFVTDTAETFGSIRDALRFIVAPGRVLVAPPERNVEGWDELCARRPVVAIGGVDAHQVGWRVLGHVPLRLMGYHRSFRFVRTHVLLDEELSVEAVYAALRAGRCYIAVDAWADATGFSFEPGMGSVESAPVELQARVPRSADLRLLRNGVETASVTGEELVYEASAAGVYRVEARLRVRGRDRVWILSNPIYLR